MLLPTTVKLFQDLDDVGFGLRANRPAATALKLYFCTDTGELFLSVSGAWLIQEGAKNASLVATYAGSAAAVTTTFTKIICQTAVDDPGSNYNSGTGIYTCPVTGLYQIVSNLRLEDSAPEGNYGQGVHTSEADGPWFLWNDTNTLSNSRRNGLQNIRTARFNAGDQLRMYYYWDPDTGSTTITAAALTITLLGQ